MCKPEFWWQLGHGGVKLLGYISHISSNAQDGHSSAIIRGSSLGKGNKETVVRMLLALEEVCLEGYYIGLA